MKKFCVIFLVFAVLGPLFAQEDWPEFAWPEQHPMLIIPAIFIKKSENNWFKNNWGRLIPLLSLEEVTDIYNILSSTIRKR
jgi:hypothetical protein